MDRKFLYIAESYSYLNVIAMMFGSKGHHVDIASDFDSAKKALEAKRYDTIFIEPYGLFSPLNTLSAKNRIITNPHPEFYGRMILTDIILKEDSLNHDISTSIILESCKLPSDPYSEESYLKRGATKVMYKLSCNMDSLYQELLGMIELQVY